MARILMNRALVREHISGRVVDIGGGRSPDYFSYLQTAVDTRIEVSDRSLAPIDYEVDALPYETRSVDAALMCNILEHIYHYEHLLAEVRRVLRDGGSVLGFVPFWVGYHPDPHDYFRYTHEALRAMLTDAGFVKVVITPVGGGPIMANFNTIVLSLPRVLRPVLYIPYIVLDHVFLYLRPASKNRYPLGYVFSAATPADLNLTVTAQKGTT